MPAIINLTLIVAIYLLWFLEIAMMVRAVLSWIPGGNTMRLADFVYSITEPFIVPIRRLFFRRGWFRSSPLDVPFFVTYIIIMALSILLDSIR